jgi:hypothetical protein
MRKSFVPLAWMIASFIAGYALLRGVESVFGMRTSDSAEQQREQIGTPATNGSPPAVKMELSAFLALCQERVSLKRDHDIFSALQHLEQEEFISELMGSVAKPGQQLPTGVIESLIKRWLQSNPEGAFRWLEGANGLARLMRGRDTPDGKLSIAVYSAFARTNLPRMKSLIDHVGWPDRAMAIQALFLEKAQIDPGQAQTWAAEFTSNTDIQAAWSGLVEGIALSDPQSAVNVVMSGPKSDERERLIARIVSIAAQNRGPARLVIYCHKSMIQVFGAPQCGQSLKN